MAQDLRAMGVKVWLNEAEIRVGEFLIAKVSVAVNEMAIWASSSRRLADLVALRDFEILSYSKRVRR
jgi:hypothetical protein